VRDHGKVGESALRAEGIAAVVRLEDGVLHLLADLNADQYAAEMRGQLATAASSAAAAAVPAA
jgi:PTS system glucose-specific IIC component